MDRDTVDAAVCPEKVTASLVPSPEAGILYAGKLYVIEEYARAFVEHLCPIEITK